MTPTITHRAKLLAHSPEPGVRALADKKMPGAIAQHLGNAGEVALNSSVDEHFESRTCRRG